MQRLLTIALTLILVLPATSASAESTIVYLPTIQKSYIQPCLFHGKGDSPIWLDVYLSVNTTPGDTSPYLLYDGSGSLLNMFVEPTTYYVGETHQLTYPLRVLQVNNIYLPPGQRTYTLICALFEQPQPPTAATPPPDDPGATVGEPATAFDYAYVTVLHNETFLLYDIGCLFWGDHEITATAHILNTDTGKQRDYVMYSHSELWVTGWVDCFYADQLYIYPPEFITSVQFKTEDSEIVKDWKEFNYYWLYLPVVQKD